MKKNRGYRDGRTMALRSKKRVPIRIWTAVNRQNKRLIDFTIRDRTKDT
ncbi:MAG: hypothetical protein LBG52_02445 [Candidatus Peribacteria bacterium]|nr:hypothetical protein [Candidatus Peribacteria bacterium]